MLALAAVPGFVVSSFAQNRKNDTPPPRPQRTESRPAPRNETPRPAPSYQPPAEGHHSGQWLNQHRGQSLDQQRQALQSDPHFRSLPPERQQRFEQRLQRFDSMPPERQQQVLRRMETWEHLTQQQKQQFRTTNEQFKSLPPDRRQAVRNAIESLRAMPPQARQRAIESGRFNHFSPQEREVLNNAAQLPLAPAEPEPQTNQPETGSQRYIPRPPH
jgi:membrane-bound lytic murein transglycosylase